MLDMRQFMYNNLVYMNDKHAPGIYKAVDEYRDTLIFDSSLDVYMPKSEIIHSLSNYKPLRYKLNKPEMKNALLQFIQTLFMIYNWRPDKKIYRFTKDITNLILESVIVDNVKDIPIQSLINRLPYKSFVVDAPLSDEYCGAVVVLNYHDSSDDGINGYYCINIGLLNEKDINDYHEDYIPYIGTSTELMYSSTDTITLLLDNNKFFDVCAAEDGEFKISDGFSKGLINTVKMIMYIASSYADITRKSPKPKHDTKVTYVAKDKFKSIEIIDVGANTSINRSDGVIITPYFRLNDSADIVFVINEYVVENKDNYKSESDKKIAECNQLIEDLRKTIKSLETDLSTANRELYIVSKKLEAANTSMQQLQCDIKNDRRELADLRDIIFNSKNNLSDDKEDESIKLPYYTKNKVTVFGGFTTWSVHIKNMLPNVRFIDKNTNSNADLVKNSDVIWIQTNAISHSSYYSIINAARTYNIPVRYFSYASARKCAEQFVKEDSK